MDKRMVKKRNYKIGLMLGLMTLLISMIAMPAFASTPTLEIDFSVENMFTWAQTIINALLPVVYVTMGIGLGFLIIRALRSAFN
ncbi:MAG TPA: hypothetical protein GX731_00675 [Clostridiales bacterium]|nr:hypothetical protein [Clostridiales bacterium]